MKLYYKPGACSLASHIALREIGGPFEIEQVDTAAGRTAGGADFRAINPKGYVPVLELEDGQVLTEGAAVLQYIADRKPGSGLAPAAGTLERTRLQEQLNFVASELHKTFSPLFAKTTPADARKAAVAQVEKHLGHLEATLADGRPYLLGETFTVADAYAFVVAGWTKFVNVSLDPFPHVKAFVARVAARDAVQAALRAEGLLAEAA